MAKTERPGLTDTDWKILRGLAKDARAPYRTLAKEIGVSQETVRKRLAKMLSTGVIQRFSVVLRPDLAGVMYALILMSVEGPFEERMKKIEKCNAWTDGSVLYAFDVFGPHDIVAVVHGKDVNEIHDIAKQFYGIEGVRTTTCVIHEWFKGVWA